jgi:spermidine/putrescine transport system permease protein
MQVAVLVLTVLIVALTEINRRRRLRGRMAHIRDDL